LRVLVLSTVFPNPRQPTLGVFIRERTRRVARHCDVIVAAPVSWFPFNGLIRGPQWTGIPRSETQEGLRVYHPRFFCVPRYGKWLDGLCYAVSLLPFLTRLRGQFPFDLIDAHFAYPDGMAAVLLGRVLRRPVVVTLRGSIVRLAGYPLHRPQLRWVLRAAARVLSVSESLKQVAVDLGVPAGKIRVIPNGVDEERFRPFDSIEARQTLGLPLDRTILLSVGGLNEGKGHHRIVALMPRLLEARPDLLYVIVGGERPSDSVRSRLDKLIDRHRLHDHVLLAGERVQAEIPLWLSAANLFCLATRSEGWANVLLEALACGCPVVSTRAGGNAEIIANESLGILVPPTDDEALAAAVLDGLRRAWDRDALVTYARRHSWDRAAEAVRDEFDAALGVPMPGATAREPASPRAVSQR
jgi:teichuronic acid biosynthesis glycosyltransferase TuaC